MSNDSQKQEEIKLQKELDLGSDFSPPSYEEWRAAAEAHLKGVPFEKALVTRTYEGIDLQPIYRRQDIEGLPHLGEAPGTGNYVRGTSTGGYLEKPWEICQAIDYSTPEAFNQALQHDLKRGQTAVSLVPDKVARTGRDADAETIKAGDVGAEGVSISTLDDLAAALENIHLNAVPLHIEAGFSGKEMLAALAALLEKNNHSPEYIKEHIKGSLNADPLGVLALHGQLPISMEKAYDHMADTAKWAAQKMPLFRTIGISGLPYNNAGASAVQELGCVLATANDYIGQLLERDLDIDTIAQNMRFTFAVGPFFFMEIAKLRAARMLWSMLIAAYGGNDQSRKMTIHAVTSRYNKTVYDPYVNMLRITTESFSAIVGGVDSLQSTPFSALFGQPDEFGRRVARNTQIILKEESHLAELIDPAGGAYFVEKLTHDVAQKSWELFQTIENKKGMLNALKEGFPQKEIEAVAAMRKKDLVKRKKVMVGNNSFADVNEKKLETRLPDYDKLYNDKIDALKKHRASLSADQKKQAADALAKLKTAKGKEAVNHSVDAFASGATIGQVFAAANGAEKPSQTIQPLTIHRLTQVFEELRDAVCAYEAKSGGKPKLFLATMGPLAQYKGRADFTKGFFEVGGFQVLYPAGFDTPDAAVEAAVQSGAQAVVICSTDDTYPQLVPPIVKGLKGKNPDLQVILAGYPKDQVEAHKAAGIDEFIFMGADVHQVLSRVLTKLGVL